LLGRTELLAIDFEDYVAGRETRLCRHTSSPYSPRRCFNRRLTSAGSARPSERRIT
jgi:hypothetical protein